MTEGMERKGKVQRVLTLLASRQTTPAHAADDLISIVTPRVSESPATDSQRGRTKEWLIRLLEAEPGITMSLLSERCIGLSDLSIAINAEIGIFAGKLRMIATI